MVLETDLLISGGGPAGLCAGIVLARQGLRTIVCEPRTYPIDKVCGQGVMPTGVADLQDYRRAHQKIVLPYYKLTNADLFLTKYPALANRAIRALRYRPDVFRSLLSINMVNIPTLPRLTATAGQLFTGLFVCPPVPERR